MGQYYKLKKKIAAGTKLIITQLGYDARKFHEVLQWLRMNGYKTPVLANIYVLPYGVAKTMNANIIAGAVVTDELLARIDQERKAEDKGKAARLNRAAQMYAIARGMGFAGAHIGGYNLSYEMVESIIDKGEELAPNWRELVSEFDFPQPNSFFSFEKDTKSGLNTEVTAKKTQKSNTPPIYWLSLAD